MFKEYRDLSFPQSSVTDTKDQKKKGKQNVTNKTISLFKFIDVNSKHNYNLQLGYMF